MPTPEFFTRLIEKEEKDLNMSQELSDRIRQSPHLTPEMEENLDMAQIDLDNRRAMVNSLKELLAKK